MAAKLSLREQKYWYLFLGVYPETTADVDALCKSRGLEINDISMPSERELDRMLYENASGKRFDHNRPDFQGHGHPRLRPFR